MYDDKKGGADMSDKRKKVILDLMEADFYVPMKEKELAVVLKDSKKDNMGFLHYQKGKVCEGEECG